MNVVQVPYELDDPQYRPWWLNWRRGRVCSTDTVRLAGVGYRDYGGPFAAWVEKTGRLVTDKPPTEEQDTGNYLEPHILTLCERRFGVKFRTRQCLITHPQHDWIGASLDCVTWEEDVWELKSVSNPREMMALDPDGDPESLPERITVQVHHQMIASEKDHITVACLVGNRLLKFVVYRNEALVDVLSVLISEFWDCVINRVPPEDFSPGDAAILARSFTGDSGATAFLSGKDADAVSDYVRLGEEMRDLKNARDVAKARILLSLGDARKGELADGRKISKSVVNIDEREVHRNAYTTTRIYVKKPSFF